MQDYWILKNSEKQFPSKKLYSRAKLCTKCYYAMPSVPVGVYSLPLWGLMHLTNNFQTRDVISTVYTEDLFFFLDLS